MTTISLTINKKIIDIQPTRMTIYKQSKIVEATDQKQNSYYLLFYKHKFLNGVRANKLKLHSHLHHAFTQGWTFSGNHPLTTALICQQKSYSYSRFNQLFKKLQQKYSLIETSLIFTFFDSFIPNEELKKLIKKAYYQYRRNGQLLAAFKVLKIYQQHDKNDHFANEMLYTIQFQRYEVIYQDFSKLTETDPTYVESVCFNHLYDSEYATLLLRLYQDQGRWIDELALQLNHFSETSHEDSLSSIHALINEHLNFNDQRIVLASLLKKSEHHLGLRQLLVEHLLSSDNDDEVVHAIMKYNLTPHAEQIPSVATCFQHTKPESIRPFYPQLSEKLVELFKDDYHLLEATTTHCISAFFDQYNLDSMIAWFEPFRSAGVHLPIEQKLIQMKALEDDPDQQYALGELYLDFNQWERSIDCFKWEMELHPTDPKPVQSLSKLYHQLGEDTEASAYQQLLIQMQK